jgi:hypothetical protein
MRGIGTVMTQPKKKQPPKSQPGKKQNAMAGGAPLALLTMAGPFAAGPLGYSPTIGLLAGLGLGVAIALLIWWRSSRS